MTEFLANFFQQHLKSISACQGIFAWLFAIAIVCTIIAIVYVILRILFSKLELKILAPKHVFANAFIYALKKPTLFLFGIFVCIFAINILQRECTINFEFINSSLEIVKRLSIVITMNWTIIRFITRVEFNLINFPNKKKPVNHTTVLGLSRVSKIIIFILTVLLILGSFNVDITGILAFGSAGTLVAGIAAKDMLANFCGGFMIFMDRQFTVGDLIRSPDKNIEGTVEHIGWRVTTIRTLQKLALYVPNAVFLTISIENETRARNRRIRQVISLRYCDLQKIPLIIENIEQMLQSHNEIDHRLPTYIVVNSLAAYSLESLLLCYTKTADNVTSLKIQQDLLLKITEIVQQYGAEIAKTTTIVEVGDHTLSALEKLHASNDIA